MNNQRLILIFAVIATLLLIPLVAMQFTEEVNWTLIDFIVMGVLLSFTGLMFELVYRNVRHIKYRVVLFAVVLGTFLIIWAELAVGILGTPFAGQ